MKTIICYCSGGLGNRLKPLASCIGFAQKTNRQLLVVWEPTLRCLAPFNSLFSDKYTIISESHLGALTNASLYMPCDAAEYESKLNGIYGLLALHRKFGSKPLDVNSILNDTADNIVVFSNSTIGETPASLFKSSFTPIKDIQNKVDEFWKTSGMFDGIVGVHARGTDFEDAGVTADYYLSSMSLHSCWSFFVCSDSKEYEEYIKAKDGRHIITRSNKIYVSKSNNGAWSNNVYTPTESVQDSLVDLLLLARTNLWIHHPNSSFAHIAKLFK
jgi:hypothetical protein